MALQKTVSLHPEAGIDGQLASVNPQAYACYNGLSDGTATAGKFAFRKAEDSDSTAVFLGLTSLTGDEGATPLGMVQRVVDSVLTSITTSGTLVYPEGHPVTVVTHGQVYITAPAAATADQAVLCDPTTGDITFGDSGATNDTGWVVEILNGGSSADEGDIIVVRKD